MEDAPIPPLATPLIIYTEMRLIACTMPLVIQIIFLHHFVFIHKTSLLALTIGAALRVFDQARLSSWLSAHARMHSLIQPSMRRCSAAA